MRLFFSLLTLACLYAPGMARAEWMVSSSPHFMVYADDSERNIRLFSDRLERYHAAMRFVTGSNVPDPSPSNRVTVFVVDSENAVRKLAGVGRNSPLAGFYQPRAGRSLAIVPRVKTAGADLDWSMIVLLHEYAHHFLISSSGFAMPRWVSEGGAEFFASASFDRDGTVWVGRPAQHRAGDLFFAKDVRAIDLLDPESYEKRAGKGYDAFYGKSWLLYHYLAFEPTRKGQLRRYLAAIQEGKSSKAAGQEVFGDADALEADLDRYLNRSRIAAFKIPPAALTFGAVTTRRLTPGEAAMMPVMIESRRGVDEKQAAELVVRARAVAAGFPQDAAVQAALAEAEHDAGHDDAAIAAADKAIAGDPTQVNAYVQKGLALFRKAEQGSDPAAFKGARAPFLALNKIEADHPLPLVYFYRSFLQQGRMPNDNAVHGLERASELAPFDLGLRMMLAQQFLRDGRTPLARQALMPIAYNPHGGSMAQAAQKMLDRIARDPNWKGEGVAAITEKAGEDAE